MGRFADRFHKLKSVVVALLLAAGLAFFVFTLCAAGRLDEHMPFETQFPLLVLLCSLGGACPRKVDVIVRAPHVPPERISYWLPPFSLLIPQVSF